MGSANALPLYLDDLDVVPRRPAAAAGSEA